MTVDMGSNLADNKIGMNKTAELKKSEQEVRFRCPHCQKLYCTNADVFADEKQPQFDCASCHKSFVLTQEANEVGLFKTDDMNQYSFVNCPKCSNLKPKNIDECPNCGIIVSKFEEIQKSESPTLFQLNKLWQNAVADFMNDTTHQVFIAECHQKQALNFAFKKYHDFKETVGFGAVCEKYMSQIELRLSQQLRSEGGKVETEKGRFNFTTLQRIFLTIGCLGVAFLVLNKIKPIFPNLTGLLVAVTLLSFTLFFVTSDENQIKF